MEGHNSITHSDIRLPGRLSDASLEIKMMPGICYLYHNTSEVIDIERISIDRRIEPEPDIIADRHLRYGSSKPALTDDGR